LIILHGYKRATGKANSSKEEAKMELFPKDSILELNTKKLGNCPSFLTITHMTLSAKWFRIYGILTIDITAEFCFWTEQRLNKSSYLGFGLAKTPGVPNTKLVGNSLSFPMVHNMAPTS
jgi:hypothetical protein